MTDVDPMLLAKSGFHALRTAAGVVRLTPAVPQDTPGAGWIAVRGSDRVRWLNGMVTNSVQALAPGEGAYSFLLNAQGRIQGDCIVWAEKEMLWLQTSSSQVAPMVALLDRFIIMDDVELSDESALWHGLLIAGPQAADALARAGLAVRASRLLKRSGVAYAGTTVQVLTPYSPLIPRFEIWSEDSTLMERLHASLLEADARACTMPDLEDLRIAEGTPRFGKDIRDRDLPQETGQARALHFSKGCYLGQEIVERIRSRGNVHRTFTSFRLTGEIPPPGAGLFAGEKQVGELTSVSAALLDGDALALGYIRRETLERALPLTYSGGRAEPQLTATAS